MGDFVFLGRRQLGGGLARLGQEEQRVVPETVFTAASLGGIGIGALLRHKDATFHRATNQREQVAIIRRGNDELDEMSPPAGIERRRHQRHSADEPCSALLGRQTTETIEQLAVVRGVDHVARADGLAVTGAAHPRLAAERVDLQPAVIRKAEHLRRLRVAGRLEHRVALEGFTVLHRLGHVGRDVRQTDQLDRRVIHHRADLLELVRVGRGEQDSHDGRFRGYRNRVSKAAHDTDGTELIRSDPWLEPFAERLRDRYAHYRATRDRVAPDGSLDTISRGHEYFGLTCGECEGQPGVWYREWAPGANYLALVGDFNDWNRGAHPLTRDEHGHWSLFLPDDADAARLTHDSRVKVHIAGADGYAMDRIPAYIRRVVQEPGTNDFTGRYWHSQQAHDWRHAPPPVPPCGLRIYEAHVGMAQEQGKVGTYTEFRENILPRIADLGYNAVQLMAVQEHPYYGSFGYHVSNLFAPSSRFGTPDELMALIDAAHGMGLLVIMDIVHSHMVRNTAEGLNRFDGTDYQYFHAGPRGQHVAWDSLCYDYSKYEVLRLLLSNVRYWLDEFRFDGFRFDGVTSMLYRDHGLGKAFTRYDDYFGDNVDADALTYLMLANEVAHASSHITIAEDVSGMPGLARPVPDGGLGFDYRLAMGVPDYWIKLLKEKRDEDWNLSDLYATLLNRRRDEKHIGYAESHDQALVGDKTLAFWLMDAAMYKDMSVLHENLVVDRGIALHKMIRLITFSLAGEGYLNFIGNEFGHPEWVDFPRAGNNNSYHYARRQWSLVDAEHLRYRGLNAFDRAMQQLDRDHRLLCDPLIEQLAVHEDTRQLVYRRGPLVFAFNFHSTESYEGLRIPVPDRADYRLVLDTDATEFGGQGRVDPDTRHVVQDEPMYGRAQSIQLYLPARTAQVLSPLKCLFSGSV